MWNNQIKVSGLKGKSNKLLIKPIHKNKKMATRKVNPFDTKGKPRFCSFF